jgi:hypothetical protein
MKTAKLGGVNDLMVAQWVRVLVVVSLQQIAFILGHESVWAFSFAGDGSINRGQSFFDTRLRVCYKGVLVNLHFVVLPMFVRPLLSTFLSSPSRLSTLCSRTGDPSS